MIDALPSGLAKYRTPLLLTFAALIALGGALAYRLLTPSPREIARLEKARVLAQRMHGEVFTDPQSGNVMPWRLYEPPGAAAGKLPLVLAFHGGHGRGDDNLIQLDESAEFLMSDALQGIEPTLVLVPQAAKRTHWVDYDSFKPPFENYDQRQIPQSENIKTAIRLLRDIIARYDVDPSRVYVTGFSMGGQGSWDSLSYYPELFAAALIVNGAGDPRSMERVKSIPVRFFHGDRDGITPTANSRELDQVLRGLNAQAQYFEVSGGHDIRSLVYTRENFAWLLQQRRPN
jgi:predicted peptidase